MPIGSKSGPSQIQGKGFGRVGPSSDCPVAPQKVLMLKAKELRGFKVWVSCRFGESLNGGSAMGLRVLVLNCPQMPAVVIILRRRFPFRDRKNHDSHRRDRILRFFLRLEIGQFSPHLGRFPY